MLLRQALLRMGSASPLSRPITTRACGTSVRAASGRSSAAAIRCWVAPPLPAVFTSVRGLASARPALGAKHINLRIKSMRGEAPVANVTKTPFSPALDFTTEPAATFEEMKLHPDIAKALRALGFEKPTDVQVRKLGGCFVTAGVPRLCLSASNRSAWSSCDSPPIIRRPGFRTARDAAPVVAAQTKSD